MFLALYYGTCGHPCSIAITKVLFQISFFAIVRVSNEINARFYRNSNQLPQDVCGLKARGDDIEVKDHGLISVGQ